MSEPVHQPDPLRPTASALVKIGSALVHAEEMMAPGGHQFDKEALDQLLTDPEVRQWLDQMGALALLPVKR